MSENKYATYTPKDSYLEAQRVWDERTGSDRARARTWQYVALTSLAVLSLSVFGNVWQGTQSKLVPYLVQVDKLGGTISTNELAPTTATNEKIVRYWLASFISDTRSVVSDGAVLKKQFGRVKVVSDNAVMNYLNDQFKMSDPNSDTNPLIIARTSTVSVDIGSVLAVSKDTWQVDWSEERRSLDGRSEGVSQWRALLTIKIQPPQDEAVARVNPIGLYITQLSWSKVLTK